MELHEINNIYGSLIFKPYKEAKNILIKNNFEVISIGQIKESYFKYVTDFETAKKLHLSSDFSNDKNIQKIRNSFKKIVIKESRKNTVQWSTLLDWLDYHSGAFYKWFNPVTKEILK